MMELDIICQLCLASWSFATLFNEPMFALKCGHENWFLSGDYCSQCARTERKCQCCGKQLNVV